MDNYIEPFAGSLAVMLKRPHWPFEATRVETVNDKDAFVVNAWRAMQADPEAVCHWADGPVFEVDLHAKHQWLHDHAGTVEQLKSDPDFYDARIAGYWIWGLSSWIGDNFCRPKAQNSVPHLGDPGRGTCADRRARLVAYYERFGFKVKKASDFLPGVMIREPRM